MNEFSLEAANSVCVCGGGVDHISQGQTNRERVCVCVCVWQRETETESERETETDIQTDREREIETENGESNSNLLLLCLILRILLHFWMLWQYNFNFYSVAASPLWFFLFSCRVSINKNIWKKVTFCWSSSTFSEAECPIANRFSRNSDESSQAMGLLQSSS